MSRPEIAGGHDISPDEPVLAEAATAQLIGAVENRSNRKKKHPLAISLLARGPFVLATKIGAGVYPVVEQEDESKDNDRH